ncbi:MAG: hypothetical protein R3F59_16330 [Myxococcota bacterium]
MTWCASRAPTSFFALDPVGGALRRRGRVGWRRPGWSVVARTRRGRTYTIASGYR